MKKVLLILSTVCFMFIAACGPSAEEQALQKQHEQDSIAMAQKAIDDSIADAMKAIEQKRMDDSTMAANAAKAMQDSIDAAKKKSSAKPKPKEIKKGQPIPGRPGAVKK